MNMERSNAAFETTCWTVMVSLESSDVDRQRECLEDLIKRYWPPVYGWLRRQGAGREEAAETTEAFFADVVLQRELFQNAARSKGRLRSLVVSALRNFRIDQSRRATARGAGLRVPIEQCWGDSLAVPDETQEAQFDRDWASAILSEALRRAERHFVRTGKERHWRLFEARVLRPATGTGCVRPLMELAREERFATPADAAAAVQVVKKRVQVLLAEVVSETVGDRADIESEVAYIRDALRS